ncbi:MAG: YegP family protein [Anaerolineales bacterium]
MTKFQLFTGKDGQFYFRLRADNGEPILASEGYKDKASAENGIRSVRENAPEDARYTRETSSDGQFFFTLRAGNNEAIGKSEMYKSAAGRDNGIAAVKDDAPGATLEDQTS